MDTIALGVNVTALHTGDRFIYPFHCRRASGRLWTNDASKDTADGVACGVIANRGRDAGVYYESVINHMRAGKLVDLEDVKTAYADAEFRIQVGQESKRPSGADTRYHELTARRE